MNAATPATPLQLSALRARAYTSIREVLSQMLQVLQVLQDGTNENYKPSGAAKSSRVNFPHKKRGQSPFSFVAACRL